MEGGAVGKVNLTVVISATQTDETAIDVKTDKGGLVQLQKGALLSEVVKALNSIGATPQDLLAILQAMKSAGALHAELEII